MSTKKTKAEDRKAGKTRPHHAAAKPTMKPVAAAVAAAVPPVETGAAAPAAAANDAQQGGALSTLYAKIASTTDDILTELQFVIKDHVSQDVTAADCSALIARSRGVPLSFVALCRAVVAVTRWCQSNREKLDGSDGWMIAWTAENLEKLEQLGADARRLEEQRWVAEALALLDEQLRRSGWRACVEEIEQGAAAVGV